MQCSRLFDLRNYPRTFLLLVACILLCIPAYFSIDFAKFWAVTSNLSYLVPLIISLEVKQYLLAVTIFIVFMISSFYHACATYGACIYNKEDSTYIDVMFSWLLLYTLASYAAFRKNFVVLIPVHFLVIILTHEAQCDKDKLGFDCEVIRILVVSIYFAFLFVQNITNKMKNLDITDTVVGLILFGIAVFFYMKSHGQDLKIVYGNHALWHTLGAAAASVILTIYKDCEVHLFGWKEKCTVEETKSLVRADVY